MRTFLSVLFLAATVSGCKPKPATPAAGSPDAAPIAITDRDWTLVSLGDNTAPAGNGGKPVTMRLATAESRAMGNAGCNQYSGPYTLSGDRLSFGPAISTKMACAQGMEVETAFLAMLNDVTSYQATDSTLTLIGASGPLARFR